MKEMMHTYLYDCRNCGKEVDTSMITKDDANPFILETLVDSACSYKCYRMWEYKIKGLLI